MSSPRTGILSLIRFKSRTDLGCVRLTNQNFGLDGSRASFLVVVGGGPCDFSDSLSPFGLDFWTLDSGLAIF